MAEAVMSLREDALTSNETQVVTFQVNGEEYGIPIVQVQEILRMGQIRQLPMAPAYVEGIMALRGGLLVVVDLRARLGLARQERTKKNRIVVANVEGKTLGMVVDSVTAVRRIPNSSITPAGQLSGLLAATHVTGIARFENRLIIMLDPEMVASGSELRAVTSAEFDLESAGRLQT